MGSRRGGRRRLCNAWIHCRWRSFLRSGLAALDCTPCFHCTDRVAGYSSGGRQTPAGARSGRYSCSARAHEVWLRQHSPRFVGMRCSKAMGHSSLQVGVESNEPPPLSSRHGTKTPGGSLFSPPLNVLNCRGFPTPLHTKRLAARRRQAICGGIILTISQQLT